jgi:hypothetical protein
MTYKRRTAVRTQHHFSRPESKRKSDDWETEATKRDAEMWGDRTPWSLSIDLGLVSWAVLDTLHFKFLLYVFGDTTLHGDRIHSTHIFI